MFVKTSLNWVDVAIWSGLVLMAILIVYSNPPSMDDYCQYHAISCGNYPNSILNTFKEPCDGSYNLKLLAKINWPCSYTYVGAAYSLLYYPLFLIWPSWHSTVLLGILLVFSGILAASRLLKIDLSVAMLVLGGAFPVMFYTLRDDGQITIQFCLLYLLPWLVLKITQARSLLVGWLLNLFTGFLFAFGVESKPMFMYFVPSMAIVSFVVCCSDKFEIKDIKLFFVRCWPGMLFSSVLIVTLFMAQDVHGHAYYLRLMGEITRPHGFWQGVLHAKDLLVTYWFQFPNAGRYIYRKFSEAKFSFDWFRFMITLPLWIILAFVALWYYRLQGADNSLQKRTSIIIALLAASAVGVLAVSTNLRTVNAHHVLQPFFYLLGALAIVLQLIRERSRKLFILIISIFMVSQFACIFYLRSQTVEPERNWERIEVIDFISSHHLAETTVIDHLDWGIYFISALYGPKEQLVINQASIKDTIHLARLLKRKVLFIQRAGHDGRLKFKDQHFLNLLPGLRRVYPADNRKHEWEIWTDASV